MSIITDRALKLLRIIQAGDEVSQRELAERVEISLGTANQAIRGLIGEGILESFEVTTSKGKRGASYHLTEYGQKQRRKLILKRKAEITNEMIALKHELYFLDKDLT